jgi:membrane complex biogenesis BtpA family protein
MLHAPALPDAPGFDENIEALRAAVLRDAAALAEGGATGLLLENLGDTPFFPTQVPPITVAHMVALATEVRRQTDLPLGINVLRNDAIAALAIAHAVGAQFIRVNVLVGAYVADQGILQGIAPELLRHRRRLRADEIKILADVHVKHAAPLAARPLIEEAVDAVRRGGADALIISGAATGSPVEISQLRDVRTAVHPTPVLVGSGVTADNAAELASASDGLIVGTSLNRDNCVSQPIEVSRVADVVRNVSSAGRDSTDG